MRQGRSARAPASASDAGKASDSASPPEDKQQGWLQKARDWVFGGPLDKEKLKSLGLGAIIAYGCALTASVGSHLRVSLLTFAGVFAHMCELLCSRAHASYLPHMVEGAPINRLAFEARVSLFSSMHGCLGPVHTIAPLLFGNQLLNSVLTIAHAQLRK